MKNISIFALLLVLALGACKKDNDTDPIVVVPPTVAKRLTGYTYDNNYDLPVSIKYDATGRIIEVNDGYDVTKNTYTGNELRIKVYRTAESREVFNFKGTLNAQGNIIGGSGVAAYNISTPELVEYTFEYNPSGYLTKKTKVANNGASEVATYYYYTNGNMSSFKTYVNGNFDYGGRWEYDTNHLDKTGLTSNFGDLNTFCGKPNKNIATKYIGIRSDETEWFSDLLNTFDADGYVKSIAVATSNGNAYKLFYKFE